MKLGKALMTEEGFSKQGKRRSFLEEGGQLVQSGGVPAVREHTVIKYCWSKGEEWTR